MTPADHVAQRMAIDDYYANKRIEEQAYWDAYYASQQPIHYQPNQTQTKAQQIDDIFNTFGISLADSEF